VRRVEGGNEGAGLFQVLQGPLGIFVGGEQAGEVAVDSLEDRRAQQQVPDALALPVQNLREQVVGDGALAAGELGGEPLGVGVPGQRQRRQPQPGGPALRPLVQVLKGGGRQVDPGGHPRHPVGQARLPGP
jgi:hypothetical protein